MGRRRTIRKLSETNIDRFMAGATDFHRLLCELQTGIRTNSDDYRTLRDLHEELVKAIESITGEKPPWMRKGPGLMG